MEINSQPSFIPKRQTRDIVARAKAPTTFFYWIGVIIFIASVLISVWFFVFERFILARQLEEKKQAIKKEIEAFDPELTKTLTILKQRIDSGEGLLARHVSASTVFELVERNTVQGVYFTNFVFTATPGETTTIEAKGESPSYAVLAFQSEVLKKSDSILNPNFFDIDLNEKGRVVFGLTAQIKSNVASYEENLKPVQSLGLSAPQVSATASSTASSTQQSGSRSQ